MGFQTQEFMLHSVFSDSVDLKQYHRNNLQNICVDYSCILNTWSVLLLSGIDKTSKMEEKVTVRSQDYSFTSKKLV